MVWFVIGLTFLYDQTQDQKLNFSTKSTLDLYQSIQLNPSTKIGIVTPHDQVKVLRVYYLDQHLLIQLQLKNGLSGWVLKTKEVDLK